MILILVVPAIVRCDRHLEMMRVQSLLRSRLRGHDKAGCFKIHSCVVFDHVDEEWLDAMVDLDFSLKLFGRNLYRNDPVTTGIRRPFQSALRTIAELFGSTRNIFVLRVIQDVVIDDVPALLAMLINIASNSKDFVAGQLDTCVDIATFLQDLQIPATPPYTYIQGAVMFAPLHVWLRDYTRLPPAITHFCDDSVMSQMVTHGGGEMIRMTTCWRHRHHCPCEESRASYDAHCQELQAMSQRTIDLEAGSIA